MKVRSSILPASLAAAALVMGAALPCRGAGTVHLRLRDAATGAFLAGRVVRSRAAATPVAETGVVLELPAEGAAVRVEAAGHRPLETRLAPSGTDVLPVTVWLDPLQAGPRRPLPAPGTAVVEGWVYDAARGRPIEAAVVTVVETGVEAVTGRDGGFRLITSPPAEDRSPLPADGTLTVEAPGYHTMVLEHLELTGRVVSILDLEPGEGTVFRSRPHRHLSPGVDQLPPPNPPEPAPAGRSLPGPTVLQPMDPPPTIRVGTSCSCTSCSSVEVMSLETYVARGLDNEWIASWDGEALRAGSIAYRSYGAWHVLHPLAGSYDICSNACCQAYGSTVYAAVEAAAHATAGFMLEEGGGLFRAEYSAEDNAWDDPNDGLSCVNSDLSCGDGRAGSPAAGWPCLNDWVCAGHGCFGHGRGMCQWGTQRWASGQGSSWPWIVNHYYNDGGSGSGSRTASMTTPLTITSAAATPSTVAAGESFQVDLGVHSGTELDHDAVLLGASLYAPGPGYIDDPTHDTLVTIAPGDGTTGRPFQVPAGTPDGDYDLLTALYYDVDGDGAIGGADLPLVLRTDPGAVTVSSLPLLSAEATTAAEGDRTTSTVTVTLTLSAPAAGEVSVDWSTRDGTAVAGLDYTAASGRATIPAGATGGTIALTVLGDYLVEGNESFFVDLANPSGATLGSSTAAVTIADDDTTPCDADASGGEDARDLAVMLRVLTDPAHEPAGNPDCNQDGALDGNDITSLIDGL